MIRRLVRLGVGLVAGGALVAAPEAPAYRLIHEDFMVGGEAGAVRWPDGAWPLSYRMLENELLPAGLFADHDAWREFLGATIQQWNDISTAELDIRLEERHLEQVYASDSDGINTIGFSSAFSGTHEGTSGFVSWIFEAGRFEGCDVNLDPAYIAGVSEEMRRDRLTGLVLHEVGHCLGLLHTDPMPVSNLLPGVNLTGFSSDPTMSYGDRGPSLTVDDIVGVSLLYPAPGFRESTGNFTGTIRFRDGAPARYAYVQAVETGSVGTRAGPGVFTDEEGTFLIEGVQSGPVMLWVHPIVVRNAHQFPGEWALSFQDQWVFAEAVAGETTEVPAVALRRGRGSVE